MTCIILCALYTLTDPVILSCSCWVRTLKIKNWIGLVVVVVVVVAMVAEITVAVITAIVLAFCEQ
jgi:hypothetical protein